MRAARRRPHGGALPGPHGRTCSPRLTHRLLHHQTSLGDLLTVNMQPTIFTLVKYIKRGADEHRDNRATAQNGRSGIFNLAERTGGGRGLQGEGGGAGGSGHGDLGRGEPVGAAGHVHGLDVAGRGRGGPPKLCRRDLQGQRRPRG